MPVQVRFDFVGAVGPGPNRLVAERDEYGMVLLDPADVTPPEGINADHPGLLWDPDENGVFRYECGDVTGNGHDDLCLQGFRLRVYEGLVTAQRSPWMVAAGPRGPGRTVFDEFRAGRASSSTLRKAVPSSPP
jgi:hypothetical protein